MSNHLVCCMHQNMFFSLFQVSKRASVQQLRVYPAVFKAIVYENTSMCIFHEVYRYLAVGPETILKVQSLLYYQEEKCCLICFRVLAPPHNLLNISDLKSFINTNFCFFHNYYSIGHKTLHGALHKRPAASNCN